MAYVTKKQAKICRAKRRYPSLEVAATEARLRGLAPYECPCCNGWHITTSAQGPEDVARRDATLERKRVLSDASHDYVQRAKRLARGHRRPH